MCVMGKYMSLYECIKNDQLKKFFFFFFLKTKREEGGEKLASCRLV